MIRSSCFFAIGFLLLPGLVSSQFFEIELDANKGCTYVGALSSSKVIYGHKGSPEAEKMVDEITGAVALSSNFELVAGNVRNAQACMKGAKRYIIYSELFMKEIYDRSGDDFSKLAVLAHEIGHHLNGHVLLGDDNQRLNELAADKFSGFVLNKLGATLEQAQVAVKIIAPLSGSQTHPPRDARLEAVAIGWQKAEAEKGMMASNGAGSSSRERMPDTGSLPTESEFVVIEGEKWRSDFSDLYGYHIGIYYYAGNAESVQRAKNLKTVLNQNGYPASKVDLKPRSWNNFHSLLLVSGFDYDVRYCRGVEDAAAHQLAGILRSWFSSAAVEEHPVQDCSRTPKSITIVIAI